MNYRILIPAVVVGLAILTFAAATGYSQDRNVRFRLNQRTAADVLKARDQAAGARSYRTYPTQATAGDLLKARDRAAPPRKYVNYPSPGAASVADDAASAGKAARSVRRVSSGTAAAVVVSGGLAAYEGIEIDNAYRNGQITMRQRNQAQAENATGAVGGLAGGLAGAAAGASIGAAGGPVGAAVGGLVGGIAGGIAGDEGGREIGRAATGGNQEELPPKIDTRRLRTGS